MAKTSTLQLLINSLTKTEKRYFKLHSSLQKGPKDYLVLFRLMEKTDRALPLKTAFLKARPGAAYEASLKHLYKVLTDCLLRVRMEQDRSTLLLTSLLKANILFEKSLYDEGFSQLKRIQAKAEEYEQHIVQLWAARLELYYLSNLDFHAITESQLIQKQMKIQEILKYARFSHQHTSLYELLRHRLAYKGNARTEQQVRELNDLVVSELNLASGPITETFQTQKTHLLFQAQYFITINDYKSALKAFYELNTLLEDHRYLWIDSPIDYLSAIEGILQSLRAINRYDDMRYFMEKLQKLKKSSVYLDVMVQRVNYIYTIAGLLDQGEFKKAIHLQTRYASSLLKRVLILDTDRQAEVYLYTALACFSNNDIDQAHHYLGKVLLDSSRYYKLPIYQTFRLIHLLIHYELGNDDYILHETRSVKRALKNRPGKTYRLEKIIFHFIRTPILSGNEKDRLHRWSKIKPMLDSIANDKYETQILRIFDFPSWIESKLCKKDFATLRRTKFQALGHAPST